MAKELVPDELWEIIEPLLPEEGPKHEGGGHALSAPCLTCAMMPRLGKI